MTVVDDINKKWAATEIIPAIDIRGGRCVRLYQGNYSKETVYSDDPISVAALWVQIGAQRIHVVDLDGAASGKLTNLPVIEEIVRLSNVPIQVGGGIRNLDVASKLLEAKVDRIVFGTAAIETPYIVDEACRKFGSERIIVAVDAHNGMVATRGWREVTGVTSKELVSKMADIGVVRFLCTDISRDGTLTQPNFTDIRSLVDTGFSIIASGGVSSLDHIVRLQRVGVDGIILGTALYTGEVRLSDAITVVEQSR